MSQMLTAQEVESLLQVDRSTVYRMAESGRLPAFKVGRQWRFPAQQVQEWLNARTTNHTSTMLTDTLADNGRLAEQLPLDCVQLIQDTFARALNVMMVTTDMSGQPVTQLSHPCGLFSAVAAQALAKCQVQWQELATQIELEPRWVRSHLGLLCARGMIHSHGELKGMVLVGGVAPQLWPPKPAEVEAIAAELEVEVAAIRPYLHQVYHLSPASQDHVLSLIQPTANIISHILQERRLLLSKLATIADITQL